MAIREGDFDFLDDRVTKLLRRYLERLIGTCLQFTFEQTLFKKSVDFACEALISCEAMLNTMDSGSGDGDCGSTLRRGAGELHFRNAQVL